METKSAPLWLFPFLKAEFSSSRTNNRNNYVFFCTTCMGNPFCKVDKSNHSNHEILKVVKASHHFAVWVSSLDGKLDYDKIAQFSFNSKSIFFLNSRAASMDKCECSNPKTIQTKRICDICAWRLPEGDTTSKYCSLGCKYQLDKEDQEKLLQEIKGKGKLLEIGESSDEQAAMDNNPIHHQQSNGMNSKEEMNDQKKTNFSFRKRSRKGTPFRSPPF